LIDLDHFKRINDVHGHAAGDRVLQTFAAVARACLREGDVLARYGGEEFVLLLPNADADRLMACCERLRLAYSNAEPMGVQIEALSLSAGMTLLAADDNLDEALQRADQALYRAKRSGRNRCDAAWEERCLNCKSGASGGRWLPASIFWMPCAPRALRFPLAVARGVAACMVRCSRGELLDALPEALDGARRAEAGGCPANAGWSGTCVSTSSIHCAMACRRRSWSCTGRRRGSPLAPAASAPAALPRRPTPGPVERQRRGSALFPGQPAGRRSLAGVPHRLPRARRFL
jgi:diguanylate cyclase (GGDEF)-like protein